MKQELMDAIQEMPVIAAVKDDAGLCSALTNENIRVVFVLYGDICNISSIVRRIHEAGRFAVVHIDLIAGLAGKEVAVDFIRNTTEADGIISTRQSFIRRAKELAGIPAGFHRAGKSGQDPRKPAGLSGSAARRYAQDPAPRLRQGQGSGADRRTDRGQGGCDGGSGSRCHRYFHHQSGGVGYVIRILRKSGGCFL